MTNSAHIPWWKRPLFKRRRWALLLILAIELAYGAFLWRASASSPVIGYVIKEGPTFLVAWREGSRAAYDMKRFSSFAEAMRYSGESLHLKLTRNPVANQELESVWLNDRFGRYVVNWKTFEFPILHHLTFRERDEAVAFFQAFRAGAYTPSLFGHSLLLMP